MNVIVEITLIGLKRAVPITHRCWPARLTAPKFPIAKESPTQQIPTFPVFVSTDLLGAVPTTGAKLLVQDSTTQAFQAAEHHANVFLIPFGTSIKRSAN